MLLLLGAMLEKGTTGLFCERDFNETIYCLIQKLWRQWIVSAKFCNHRNQSGLSIVISNSWRKPLHPLYSMINMPSYLQNSLTNLTAVLCRGGTTIGSSKFGWCLGVGWCRWQPCKEMRYYHHSEGCTIFVHEQSIIGEHGIWCVYYVAWLFASQLLNFYHPLPSTI